jgi:chromosome segregation ATPase
LQTALQKIENLEKQVDDLHAQLAEKQEQLNVLQAKVDQLGEQRAKISCDRARLILKLKCLHKTLGMLSNSVP